MSEPSDPIRPPFRSREGDPQSVPRSVVDALATGWTIEINATEREAPFLRDLGTSIFLTSSDRFSMDLCHEIGPIKLSVPVPNEALGFADLVADVRIESPEIWAGRAATRETNSDGWNACRGLCHEAAKNASRVRVRNLASKVGFDHRLAVADVTLQLDDASSRRHRGPRGRRSQPGPRLLVRGTCCVIFVPAPDEVIDLTGELVDDLIAHVTSFGVEVPYDFDIFDSADISPERFAELVRRPEVEDFAGNRYDPNKLIDVRLEQAADRKILVAADRGHLFGFVSLSDSGAGYCNLCPMIVDPLYTGRHLSKKLFEAGLDEAWQMGFIAAGGASKPPCRIARWIQEAGGDTWDNASTGEIEWRVYRLESGTAGANRGW